jgi:UDP-N-acetylglucosamine 4,6-dehydratase
MSYKIIVFVKEESQAFPVISSILDGNKDIDINIRLEIGREDSFAKTVNKIIMQEKNNSEEILIFCSHRVRPSYLDIQNLLSKIEEGHGLVTLYRLACFGFRKELFNIITLFDTRYLIGGYEDNDLYIRLQEADISYYENECIEYHKGESTWKHPPGPLQSKLFFEKKWTIDTVTKTINRNLDDLDNFLQYSVSKYTPFKKWRDSHLIYFSEWQKIFTVKSKRIINKKIIIIGGTGSLGYKLIEKYGYTNDIIIYSRDELKQSELKNTFKNLNITCFLGNIRDYSRIEEIILEVNPDLIIIAAALKHIDSVEYEVDQSLQTNTIGPLNVCRVIKKWHSRLNLSAVIYISTDKSCNPITVYGMCKSLGEKTMIEYSKKMSNTNIKFLSCRYGNVINSRGSIIPKLQELLLNENPVFLLTHPDMTRFIMTQSEAVNLINFSITSGKSGEIIIPKLRSIKIIDLLQNLANKNTTIKNIGMRGIEKMHEELLTSEEITRSYSHSNYYCISPPYLDTKMILPMDITSYSSENCLADISHLFRKLSILP